MNTTRVHLAACALCGTLLITGPASAQEFTSSNFSVGPTEGQLAEGAVVFLVALPASIANLSIAAIQGSNVAARRRSSSGLQTAGYLLGAVSITAGTSLIIAGSQNSGNTFETIRVATEFLSLGGGVLDVGFTLWAARQPDRASPVVSLSPYAPRDRMGRPALGLQVALLRF